MTTTTATATVAPHITEGSIFVSSWGYDQTNVDFYRVVRRTKATVWVQQVSTATVTRMGPCDDVTAGTEPVKGAWVPAEGGGTFYDRDADAPIERHRLQVYSDRPHFAVNSFANAYEWDGKPEYQTGFGWGH